MLFGAARSQLASTVIGEAKAAGRDVVCDRYIDSTAAYQGAAIGGFFVDDPRYEGRDALDIGLELIEWMNSLVIGECVPDLTLLIRVEPDEAVRRGRQRLEEGGEDGSDRFEARGEEFQSEVAAAYDEIAARNPERIVVIDGAGEPAEVHARVIAAVEARR